MYVVEQKLEFPPVSEANSEGLLAVGGDLSVARLVLAYSNGIFPWFNDDALILWWSPAKRMVLKPSEVKISKSMRKVLRTGNFRLTKNTCFAEVMKNCSKIERKDQDGTWITHRMQKAYSTLHEQGWATSYEVWNGDNLVGGLYGIDLGHVFCGESMFSIESNASKYAFIKMAQELEEKGYKLIDCQMYTEHLASLGAKELPRKEFIKILKRKNKAGQ
ncbi:MAG: leucyl/phenylalanyl-tRNA--protein transferase [Flavobacterium sp.]|nr:leucyl/phenylalanyl-tRNA--protein transferase [Pseudozobellia sp.]MBF01638.1 leucyl/phenylalanyl-tRNA--protein transferase [Flavobacterium sp.]MBG46853.1 leucyl/phenylalanyl-tRNA--protein transferase [Pseudozobellia sp.]|tara:strand:- start:1068354 stop:1069007 length:654 start_codon:yes stop_codon:yes gene_type:complete